MHNGIVLEICCGSAEDAFEAAKGGADRIELNNNLFQGGLTPSLGTLEITKEKIDIPVMVMVRPRAGGFCYTETELDVARADARALLRHGADGLVFGFLNADGTVNTDQTRAFVELAEGKTCVFHRALDVVPEWKRALEQLIEIGITRVLTSGQQSNVFFALETIREMITFAGNAIEIMPGAGITLENVNRVVEETGCTQVHLACHRTITDTSVANNRDIYFGGCLYPPEDRIEITDRKYVAALRNKLKLTK